MIRGLVFQEDITILNVSVPKTEHQNTGGNNSETARRNR